METPHIPKVVGGSDPIRTRENRVAKHHLITSLCVFFPTARSVL